MHTALLTLLRCPYCGSTLEDANPSVRVEGPDGWRQGVLGCQCCAYPVVAGIPVLIADETSRTAIDAIEAGRPRDALSNLLGLSPARADRFHDAVSTGRPTFRDLVPLLCEDAEGDYLIHRFSDPTFVTMEALIERLGRRPGRWLDLCGGAGHALHVATGGHAAPSAATEHLLVDRSFWKLWLARHRTAPGCAAVCADAEHPLPFPRAAFSTVLLADAFPYIWHKRLLADEVDRALAEDGVLCLPHLHSALGENHSAGDTLTPTGYATLFARRRPRLLSDRRLLDDLVETGTVDLTAVVPPEAFGDEPSLTLVAGPEGAFDVDRARLPVSAPEGMTWRVNPLYAVDGTPPHVRLTLTFPTAEYADEFGEVRRYLPDQVALACDPAGPLTPGTVGADEHAELVRRRVLLRCPPDYV